ncbi:hypothetical protein HYH02_006333 [Chlamydomonas schloesseri]|uniref:Uncharacterized protein n=1 Tax=Chlamydomonas schloesseri TaxID=2026947 RepID=A0A835WJX0_9CHLO|nr:hypothetical protein HYH02_006333 [Chlamydomonas schloesseri]|eukprot:KAG2448441.1 hypothetical protein HYH02_006333 [Chlamydomonas schloesseri]
MQASFTPQEQELIDKLRDKYAGQRAEQEVDTSCLQCVASTGPTASSSGKAAGSNVDASVCPHCQGTGTIVEIYNHRRLENYCQNCEGRGVRIFKNGVEVKEGAKVASLAGLPPGALHSGNVKPPAGITEMHERAARGQGEDGEQPGGSDVAERVAALHADLKRIGTRTAAYAKERLEAVEVVNGPAPPGCADPAGRRAAAQALVAALDLQLEKLELARRKKAAALGRLEGHGAGAGGGSGEGAGAGGVTLQDVIENEGSA